MDQPCSPVAVQYLRCHLSDGVGPVLLARVIKHFGALDAALGASVAELTRVEGIGPRRAAALFATRDNDGVERELERAAAVGARIICWEDSDYPPQLRHCDDPPVCLYVRGTLEPEDARGHRHGRVAQVQPLRLRTGPAIRVIARERGVHDCLGPGPRH